MANLLNAHDNVFPNGAAPKIFTCAFAANFKFTRAEKSQITRMRKELKKDPLGDTWKLSIRRMDSDSKGNISIDACPILYSELMGAIMNGSAILGRSLIDPVLEEYMANRGIRTMLSNNLIVSRDGKIVLSGRDRRLVTPLNGYVEASSLDNGGGSTLLERTVAKEIAEEYGILEGLEITLHSVHTRCLSGLPGGVRFFGSVRVPLTFSEIEVSKMSAPDAYENPLIIAIENTVDGVQKAISRASSLTAKYLSIYSQAVLEK
jgi:hypothetical protein